MIIRVKVKPGSKTESIKKLKEGENEYVVSVKEPAEKGRANKKLINLLAKEFKVQAKDIKIKNPISKKKIVEIAI